MRNCQIRPLKTQAALELLLVAENSIRVSTHLFVHASLKPLQLSSYVTFQYRGTVFVITDGRGRSGFLSSRNLKRNVCPLTLRRLMSYIYIYIYIYIYGAPILDVSRSHTTTQHIR